MNKTKYQRIADEIKAKIISGEIGLHEAISPELQLQKDYDVSRHTVRQAIATLVNEGYLRKEKGSGTYVDDAYKKRSANKNQQKTIGVITTYLSDYIFPSIIRGIEKGLSQQGYSLLLASTNNDYQQEKACLEKMIQFGVDGLIVEPTKSNQYNPNLALYVQLREQGIPMVMINAVYEELDAASLCVDDVKVGFLATEHLIRQQHENLLLVTKIDDLQGKYRMKGFIQACEQYDIQFAPEDIITYTTETRKQVPKMVKERLKAETITGLVCYNDQIASLLLDRLVEEGYQIPEALSIIGNDDSALSKVGAVKLTTLTHPKEQMGRDAAEWIVTTIETGKRQADILYEPQIVERDSVSS
ncbi:GntR family transcriptional regulator [Enterococcus florum]|uniref:GntR family transcriptional regulator n=1 Tax=Enterococcus florum TaxID=2480627 RepID=A0A4P5P9L0_9ENTE|nr:GntR family transcriptional regulator [Enterococcus florum]GCF92658.1 GntR family transcriptional regulator [Enterococcus florum]